MTTFKSNLHSLQGQAASRAADDAKRRFAKALSPPPPGLDNRQGRLSRRGAPVTGWTPNGTVNLSMDGTTVPNVICLASYNPVVGDPVILDFLGEDPLVVGTPATGTNSSGVQPGTILDFGGGTMPGGYLATNGAAVSRTIYARLFAAIGTGWGAGDGSTTFNVPDIRGRGTIGAGTGGGLTARTLASTLGAETTSHTHTSASHNHTLSDAGQCCWAFGTTGTTWVVRRVNASWTANLVTGSVESAFGGDTAAQALGVALTGSTDTTTPAATGATAPSIMQPSAVTTKMIKF